MWIMNVWSYADIIYMSYIHRIASWLLQYCTQVPVTCDNPSYSPDGPTVGRLGNLTKCRPAASNRIIVSLVVVIVYFLNFNNFSRFRYSYMYIMMFIPYICIFSDKLPSHKGGLQTFGLLLILSRFIGLPRYSYQPIIIIIRLHKTYI